MKKQILSLKDAKVLDKAKQKEINGGRPGCLSNCSGQPNGTMCCMGGHPGCPGYCISNQCMPW
ncbi:MAG: hypothetical protein KTR30_09350 [Saprospiraceae bacterium]|nr:hypothetical protein [Saprospiraceae bacterium]